MKCPYCKCRSLSWIDADLWSCIECGKEFEGEDAFDYDTGVSDFMFGAILFGIGTAAVLLKLIF